MLPSPESDILNLTKIILRKGENIMTSQELKMIREGFITNQPFIPLPLGGGMNGVHVLLTAHYFSKIYVVISV